VLGRLVRFGLVGGVATAIQYVILVALVHAGVAPPVGSAIGFVVSAFGNYLLNYHFTFRSRESHGIGDQLRVDARVGRCGVVLPARAGVGHCRGIFVEFRGE
jgi:putative flippase GtrA